MVVVVDNFSDESERQQVRSLAATFGWNTVLSDVNLGFGGGMNAGASAAIQAGADHLLLLNPDATIDASSLQSMVEELQRAPRSLVAPVIVDGGGNIWFDGADVYLDDGHMRPTRRRGEHPGARVESWLTGACLLTSAGLWQELGGFDEEYFLYWEDVDLSVRATRLGARLTVARRARAVHDEGGTQEPGHHHASKSEVYYYYNIRNRLMFAAKNLSRADIRDWLAATPLESRQILLRGGRRQFLHPVAPMRAAYRGVRDGRRIARRALADPT